MYGIVIGLGLLILLGASSIVGVLLAHSHQRVQRLRISKRSWELYQWEQELLNTAELNGCPSYRLMRRRSELQYRPIDEAA